MELNKDVYIAPKPSQAQLNYLEEGLAAFVHFGINTYYEREWGDGKEDISLFNPTELDCEQWVKVLKEAGFKRLILVVKHHDGFVLYPTQYSQHSVRNIPWADGQGDILLEVSKAVSKYDMGLGIYLSPWDAHDERYSVVTQEAYNVYYLNQLEEILENPKYGNNGKFVEIWMDGARGENEEKVCYEFEKWFGYIRSRLGDDVCIFSTQDTSVRWIGNEAGYANQTLWQRVRADKMSYLQPENPQYLISGDEYGDIFSIAEADVSIRNGWFYKEGQQLKSVEDLMGIYLNSVGKGTVLLLNIPPNKKGKFAEEDITRLMEFRNAREGLYSNCCYQVTLDSVEFRKGRAYSFDLGTEQKFNLIELKENITSGQTVSNYKIEYYDVDSWKILHQGTTIGFKQLIPIKSVTTKQIRIIVEDSIGGHIKLDHIALYYSEWLSNRSERTELSEVIKIDTRGKVSIALDISSLHISTPTLYKITTQPITAVHGKHYIDLVEEIMVSPHTQVVNVETEILYSSSATTKLEFWIQIEDTLTARCYYQKIEIC